MSGHGDPSSGHPAPVYRRSLGSRVISTSVLVGTALLLAWFLLLEPEPVPRLTLGLLGFFFLVSAWLTVTNFGDRIRVGPEALRIQNRFLEPLGWKPRIVAWKDVVGLRSHRSRALFLLRRQGRAVVVDSVERFAELSRLIQERTGLDLPKRPSESDPEDLRPPAAWE